MIILRLYAKKCQFGAILVPDHSTEFFCESAKEINANSNPSKYTIKLVFQALHESFCLIIQRIKTVCEKTSAVASIMISFLEAFYQSRIQ